MEAGATLGLVWHLRVATLEHAGVVGPSDVATVDLE